MAYQDFEDEKNAIDLITDSMFSLDFLKFYTDSLADPSLNQKSVEYLYSFWLGNRHIPISRPKIPFSMGAILGYLYVGILFAKEGWYGLLPDQALARSAAWGVDTLIIHNPCDPNIKLPAFARRLRNSLGHGMIKINVPMDGTFTPDNVEETVTVTFKDINPKDQKDIFEATMKISEIEKFIQQFQRLIYHNVASRNNN